MMDSNSSTSQRYVVVPNHMLNTELTTCIYGVWALENEQVEWILNSANKVIGYNIKYTLPAKACKPAEQESDDSSTIRKREGA